MKNQLEQELLQMIMPVIPDGQLMEWKAKLTILLDKYDVTSAERQLVKYEGDMNEIILKRFLVSKLTAGCSRRTVELYENSIRYFFRHVNKRYDEITSDDIKLFLARKLTSGTCGKVGTDNYRRCLSSFYTWLQKEEVVLKNPMNKVDPIKITKKKKKAYSLLDMEKIRLGCRSNRERALVEVLASTWARISEVLGIKIENIEDDKITVRGKGDKYRQVYLNARAKMAVELYLQERSDSNPYLFPRAKYGGDLGNLSAGKKKDELVFWYRNPDEVDEVRAMDASSAGSIIRNIGNRAGVQNVHPHRFRRTGATMALRSGMPLLTVSKLLGHESVETTQIYLDVSEEELEQMHKKYVI